jgi:hypothetical protein
MWSFFSRVRTGVGFGSPHWNSSRANAITTRYLIFRLYLGKIGKEEVIAKLGRLPGWLPGLQAVKVKKPLGLKEN